MSSLQTYHLQTKFERLKVSSNTQIKGGLVCGEEEVEIKDCVDTAQTK